MSDFAVKQKPWVFRGETTPPGDKSVSHRAVLLGALAEGKTRVRGFLAAQDTLSTVSAVRSMGVGVATGPGEAEISGNGLFGLRAPRGAIDAGNSGTTARLLAGILSAQDFASSITGDASLRSRPMSRITLPLRRMGARFSGKGDFLPLGIEGADLAGTTYAPPQASAQVKSAVLLAGLYAEGETRVVEKVPTRDHTERMLRHFGVGVGVRGNEVSVSRAAPFRAADVEVPSDISSAAFFMVAAAINPGSEVLVRNVGVNPLRAGVLDVLREMGADISEENRREVCGEPVADLVARYAPLRATRVDGDLVSRAIDELPAVAVAACFAEGETVITGAGELRVKESDRISAMAGELRALGADVEELSDGMAINGAEDVRGGRCRSLGDHRVCMSLAVAATRAREETVVEGAECAAVSFPGFFETFSALGSRG